METFTTKTFHIPKLVGVSEKNIEEHLKLYKGYVTNTNLVLDKIEEYNKDQEANSYILGEMYRRFSFEFNGMRNHEYYFSSISGGPKEINKEGNLYKTIVKNWNSFENFISQFKKLAMTRGIGWAMLYNDKSDGKLFISWVDEQHLGQLNGISPILCLDMWEHSYITDYQPSGKKQYIEDFFVNINWGNIENNFKA
jgi:Fe-Mn family superoxide dismutase